MLDCISYLCFSPLVKLFLSNLDTSLTLPRHLAICRALKLFLIAILIDPRQLSGSIGKVPRPSIASWQLVNQSSFSSCVFALFLDTFSTVASVDIVFLDTFLDKWLNTSICRELLRIYIKDKCDPILTFLDLTFDRSVFSPPKLLSLTPNLLPK